MAWNGSDGAGGREGAVAIGATLPKKGAKSGKANGFGEFMNSPGGWLVAGLGVLGVIGGIGWGISGFRGGSGGHAPEVSSRIKEQRPATVALKCDPPDVSDGNAGCETPPIEPSAPPPPPKKDWQQLQREAMARKLGRQKEHKVFVNDSNATDGSGRKPIHRNSAEHIMSMVFTTNLGDMPPPLPTLSERDRMRLAQILTDKFEIDPNDPDAEEKQILNEVKDALAEYIREGGVADEFFSTYHRQLELAHRERTEARKLVLETAREGDAELAKELLDRFNENLESKGVKPVNLPHWIIEKKASVMK